MKMFVIILFILWCVLSLPFNAEWGAETGYDHTPNATQKAALPT